MAKLKPGDRVLIAVAALAAAGALAWFAVTALLPAPAQDARMVVCQTREGFYRADPLNAEVTYTVETSEGTNDVTISGGKVDVVRADCDNQVCVEHDPIASAGEQIVCLPHGMVIEVVENEADAAQLM